MAGKASRGLQISSPQASGSSWLSRKGITGLEEMRQKWSWLVDKWRNKEPFMLNEDSGY